MAKNPRPPHAFKHRSYYIQFASHLLNSWNVNVLFPDAPGRWEPEQFGRFLDMVKAFGFTCLEYWVASTLYDPEALANDGKYAAFAGTMRRVNEQAHARGLETRYICVPNCMGHRWYYACPNDADNLALIEKLWRHWTGGLRGTDIVGIFPGDPGGCNRNGCDHNTPGILPEDLRHLRPRPHVRRQTRPRRCDPLLADTRLID